jgi:arginase
MSKQIQFIFNPSELGAGSRGSSLGPNAILTTARSKKSSLFQNREIRSIEDHNDLLNSSSKYINSKYIDGINQVFSNISAEVASTFKKGAFPIIIAGDHSSAGGTIAGIASHYPHKKLGVLWIDAHADLHTPFTTPSGNVHGMPVATALGLDNVECKKNEIDNDTFQLWNKLKSNSLNPDNLVYIAVRDTEAEENFLMDKFAIKNYTVDEVRKIGVGSLLSILKDKFKDVDCLYVSFDVDSMDPELTSHGTGTPVPHGLTPEEAKELLDGVCKFEKLVALEIVEVNPCLDEKKNKMAEITFELIESIVQTLEN